MFGRRVLLVAALAVCGSQAGALPVRVALDWPAGIPASAPAQAHIQAVWTAGPANNGVPPTGVEAEAGPDGVILDLGDGVWQVQASASGYWSQAAEVVVARKAPATVRLTLWPAATLHGEIQATEGEPLPEALEVRLSATPSPAYEVSTQQASVQQTNSSPSGAELRCRIEEGSWSCLGPAGLFDVELEATGYTPRYEWGVSLKAAESTDLGRTPLLRTASVFGRAVRKDGSNPPGPCRAALRPETMRGASEPNLESARQGETSFSVPLSLRGYFQVVGVSPGMYLLNVECQAASGIRELSVQAGAETRVDPPLLLGELTLDIAIAPKADPEGQPWELTVDATASGLRRIADKARTSEDGHWTRRGLSAGSYRVIVNSSDGTPWLQRDFELGAGSGPLSLRLAFVRVAGRAQLGMQPVAARLDFSNDEAGGKPVTFTSDDSGSFQGLLPVPPGVRETSWTVEGHVARVPGVRRLRGVSVPSVAGGARSWLELDLPTIAVRGVVVSEDGQPQSGVQVTLEEANLAQTMTSTDEAGSFELPDLPPGKYTAVAESFEGVSERTAVDVAEGSENVLKLILKLSNRIPFYVVSSQGPVSDATVQVWIPPGAPRFFTHTDQDGRFEVKLPDGIAEVGLTVGAPGYATKLTRMPVSTAQAPSSSGSDESPNANTITLDASAGTLELDLKPPEKLVDSPVTPYLVHDGAIQEARTLADWGSGQAGVSNSETAEVEAIEPGTYALCFLAGSADLAAIWQGALPPDRCRKGSLERGQTLTLSPR
jgi:hypothetical protein